MSSSESKPDENVVYIFEDNVVKEEVVVLAEDDESIPPVGEVYIVDGEEYLIISHEISEDEEDEKDLIEVRAEDEQINQATKYSESPPRPTVKRKRGIVLPNQEEKNQFQVVGKRDVQLFSRDEIVDPQFCPDFHSEEVVLSDTQSQVKPQRRRRTAVKRRRIEGRPSGLANIKPKPGEPGLNAPQAKHSIIPDDDPFPSRILVAFDSLPTATTVRTVPTTPLRPVSATPVPARPVTAKPVTTTLVPARPVNPPVSVQPKKTFQILPDLVSCATESNPQAVTRQSLNQQGLPSQVILVDTARKVPISRLTTSQISSQAKPLDASIPSAEEEKEEKFSSLLKENIKERLSAMLPIKASPIIKPTPRIHWELGLSKKTNKCQYPRLKEYTVDKHRWLWQFMKELFVRKDPCLQWEEESKGRFFLQDIQRLGVLWGNYKKAENISAKSWRQMRYYFSFYEENNIIRLVYSDKTDRLYVFEPMFYRERFIPYKFKPVKDFKALEKKSDDESIDISHLRPVSQSTRIFCGKGCGSQFRKSEARDRHESVCTFAGPAFSEPTTNEKEP